MLRVESEDVRLMRDVEQGRGLYVFWRQAITDVTRLQRVQHYSLAFQSYCVQVK